MNRTVSSYGELPSFVEFKQRFEHHVEGPLYKIRNMNEYTGNYNVQELFALVVSLKVGWENGNEDKGSLASDILDTLGIEWV
jgi:hypothetical protein